MLTAKPRDVSLPTEFPDCAFLPLRAGRRDDVVRRAENRQREHRVAGLPGRHALDRQLLGHRARRQSDDRNGRGREQRHRAGHHFGPADGHGLSIDRERTRQRRDHWLFRFRNVQLPDAINRRRRHMVCATPPAPGQALVTATVNSCPTIDGVSASPSSAAVGSSMALQVTAHDPDSGPAVLTYAWSADGGTFSGSIRRHSGLHLQAAGDLQHFGRGLGRRRNLRRGSSLRRHLHGALRK